MPLLIIIILLYISIPLSSQGYTGGTGDGYSLSTLITTDQLFYGGTGDGYEESNLISSLGIFIGGTGDGFDQSSVLNNFGFYTGGSGDGYDVSDFFFYLNWTGATGSGWNVGANWEGNVIPNENVRVYIPSNSITMPAVNAGNFIIGNDPSGTYKCKSLWIQGGANLLTRANCFVINKSDIIIGGVFRFKNQATNAFINLSIISIKSEGELKTDF